MEHSPEREEHPPVGDQGPADELRDDPPAPASPVSPLREIVQPFIDLARAPRALWGICLSYLIEGMVYFGIIGLLGMYFLAYVFGTGHDVEANWMVTVLTAGITISMFFFGGLADRWGIRVALFASLALMLAGRVLLSGGVPLGLPQGQGMFSALHHLSMGGILLVVLGYGMYQPACYSAMRQFTTPKTATMGYAMLYALMNLGGWLPSFFSPPVRRAYGISGVIAVFTVCTAVALLLSYFLLSRRTVASAIAEARAASPDEPAADSGSGCSSDRQTSRGSGETEPARQRAGGRDAWRALGPLAAAGRWLRQHPLGDGKFAFFIFSLIPVQTLFAYNWLVLPYYVERAYRGTWIGHNFEAAVNFNPILIFILVPVVAALTQKRNVYNMMIAGTFVMAAPTFLLVLGAGFWTLLGYLVVMTIGEAMWQPRFLQYAAEIAPEGKTGAYIGVAQLPWFLTKMIAGLYSGWFLTRYCPEQGELRTEAMWLIFGLIALSSSLLLLLVRGWLGRDFKTRAAD